MRKIIILICLLMSLLLLTACEGDASLETLENPINFSDMATQFENWLASEEMAPVLETLLIIVLIPIILIVVIIGLIISIIFEIFLFIIKTIWFAILIVSAAFN